MSESYSDFWKGEFLEQHPEIAAEHQGACVPHQRIYPSPATPWTVPHTPSAPYTVPATPKQTQNAPHQRMQERLMPQGAAYQHRTASQAAQALVRAACELRYQLRLTQRAFAEKLGINPRTWQEWEQGRRLPTGPGKALLEQWLVRHQDM